MLIAAVTTSVPAVTTKQEAVGTVAKMVSQMIKAASPAQRGHTLGGIVRLAFHDAATFNGVSGGADGCLDLTALANRGLQEIVDSLAPAVKAVADRLSRADVWALAANVAIQAAGGPKLVFEAGRVDSSSCTGTGSLMPDAEKALAEVRSVFVQRLNFTERETAALNGAHVLGRALAATSGYNGQWVPRNDQFTNQYFVDLLNINWIKQARPSFENLARTQWNGPPPLVTLMLNTDVSLAFDTSSGCTRTGRDGPGACPRASNSFSSAVTEFAGNGAAFQSAFGPAFRKLMALGSQGLRCVMPDCSTPVVD